MKGNRSIELEDELLDWWDNTPNETIKEILLNKIKELNNLVDDSFNKKNYMFIDNNSLKVSPKEDINYNKDFFEYFTKNHIIYSTAQAKKIKEKSTENKIQVLSSQLKDKTLIWWGYIDFSVPAVIINDGYKTYCSQNGLLEENITEISENTIIKYFKTVYSLYHKYFANEDKAQINTHVKTDFGIADMIIEDKENTTIYEFKTDLRKDNVKRAIGQILTHSQNYDDPKLKIIGLEGDGAELATIVNELGIELHQISKELSLVISHMNSRGLI
ncbi:hypothetical protein [Orenia marismortui]|uniref:hypothetical protein n=1 Tax=Orenia marismortui TaxID=46469 RepID=UPI00037285CB|nr:hypothetical protein [Orenia marismortui]